MAQRKFASQQRRVDMVRQIMSEIAPTPQDILRQHWALASATLLLAVFAGSGGTLLWIYEIAAR